MLKPRFPRFLGTVSLGRKIWVFYKLFIPKKFQQRLKILLDSGQAYNVRLKNKDETHFKVIIDFKTINQKPEINFDNGVVGIDVNPDRIAVANITADGNLINAETFINTRIFFASKSKRDYDLGCLVKKIINYANSFEKGIVFEELYFEENYFNKRQNNFAWKKFIILLERKCIEHKIEYKKVNPAYTSIIGKYKYRRMYKLTIHESAAYTVGRRGLGYKENLSFYKLNKKKLKDFILGTFARKYQNNRHSSWLMWKKLNDKIEAVLTGLPISMTDLKEFVGNNWCRNENLRSEVLLQELCVVSKTKKSSDRRKSIVKSKDLKPGEHLNQ